MKKQLIKIIPLLVIILVGCTNVNSEIESIDFDSVVLELESSETENEISKNQRYLNGKKEMLETDLEEIEHVNSAIISIDDENNSINVALEINSNKKFTEDEIVAIKTMISNAINNDSYQYDIIIDFE